MQIIPCRAAPTPSNITAILYFDVQLVLLLCLPFAPFAFIKPCTRPLMFPMCPSAQRGRNLRISAVPCACFGSAQEGAWLLRW